MAFFRDNLGKLAPDKPFWILMKQEMMGGIGINWTICKSAPHARQITMPAPHHSIFLQAGCPCCFLVNSIKALKTSLMNIDKL